MKPNEEEEKDKQILDNQNEKAKPIINDSDSDPEN